MKIIITEEQKKKLFIPRKLSKDNHRWIDHNNSQPIKDGIRINQYDENGLRQGYWENYHSNGVLLSKGDFKDNKAEGYWEIYWDNGKLDSKGNYVNGKRKGYWEYYYDNGELYSKGRYVDGEVDGYWEFYWGTGSLNRKGNYVNGKREGYWEFYWGTGSLNRKGNYVNGKREGYWEEYYDNGEIKFKGNYVNGEKVKNLTESEKKKIFIPRKLSKGDSRFDEHNNSQPIKNINGEDIRINQYDEDGRKQGYWEFYWSDGRLWLKGNYVANKKDGYWEEYWNNGQLWSKGSYVNDKVDGYWEEYFENGKLKSKDMYKDDELVQDLTESEKKKLFIPRKLSKGDSRFDEWNNSQPIKDGVRINQYDEEGNRQGYWEIPYNNHPEKKLMQKGYYINNKKEGRWVIFYPNGKIYLSSMFKNNEIVK